MSQITPRPAVRIDLHCHSNASNEADEAVLNALKCPESYSRPDQVYAQAKRRGMDLVTITDHDSLDGVNAVADRADVLVGEELTCYFPEDRCKIHLLVWGLNDAQHAALQARASDIYAVAAYVEEHALAHSVAHALYRQNDRLGRWHLERLVLMFKGFECLNGAHSALHREALDPFLDALTARSVAEMSARHGLPARWPEPWVKARTGGSDDHGLFNVGRTWTEFPPEATTPAAICECIRAARCRPGGEAGSSLKLAHNLLGVAVRYYVRQVRPAGSRPTLATVLLEALVGDRAAPRRVSLAALAARGWVVGMGRRLGSAVARAARRRPGTRASRRRGTALTMDLMRRSLGHRLPEHAPLTTALRTGAPPLAEHESAFSLASAISRDWAQGLARSVKAAVAGGELAGLFDAVASVVAQQALMVPYYFALFHQNRERHLLAAITGHGRRTSSQSLRVCVFSDALDESNNDPGRFLLSLATAAASAGSVRQLTVATCSATPSVAAPWRRNFAPLLSREVPNAGSTTLALPPVLEVLEWADRQQFDVIQINTLGPMGLCGWLTAQMLRVPVVMTHHVDPAAAVQRLTGDHRLTSAAATYARWFYGRADAVLARSRHATAALRSYGLPDARVGVLPPVVEGARFSPQHRDVDFWRERGVGEPHRLLYRGPFNANPDTEMTTIIDAFASLCGRRRDAALVLIGEGPGRAAIQQRLAGLPAYFMGEVSDAELPALYASGDLLLFPGAADGPAQAVLDAQASGLPVVGGDRGAGRDLMDDGITGRIVRADDAAAWCEAIDALLTDAPHRSRMARTGPQRTARFTAAAALEAFWSACAGAAVDAKANVSAAAVNAPAAAAVPVTGVSAADADDAPVAAELVTLACW